MAVTRLATVDRAANDLGVLRLGQALQSADQTRLNQAYDEVYADLKDEGIATWTSTGSVPNELATHVVALMCEQCSETYSLSDNRFARLSGRWGKAKSEIRRLTTERYESLEDPVNY